MWRLNPILVSNVYLIIFSNFYLIYLGARVIVDLSWPYLFFPDIFSLEPISVNDGIDPEAYPTNMTSMEAVIELINRAGPEAHLVKQDWADGKAML